MGFIGRDCFSGGGWDLWGEPFGLRRRKFGVGKSGDNFCLERRKSAQISLSPQGAGARKSSSLPNFTLSDVGGLKSSVVGVSTPEKLANATSQNSFWDPAVNIHCQHQGYITALLSGSITPKLLPSLIHLAAVPRVVLIKQM